MPFLFHFFAFGLMSWSASLHSSARMMMWDDMPSNASLKTSTIELSRRMGVIWPKLMAFSLPFISEDGMSRSPMIPHRLYANQKIFSARLQMFEPMSAISAKYTQPIVLTNMISSTQPNRFMLCSKEVGGVMCDIFSFRFSMAWAWAVLGFVSSHGDKTSIGRLYSGITFNG